MKTQNGLILVAHPDDEVIFAGGLLLAYPERRWTIACVTYSWDDERGYAFANALSAYRSAGINCSGIMLGCADTAGIPTNFEFGSWRARAQKHLTSEFDIVITHGPLGEYGHPHHIATNKLARLMFRNIWTFGYAATEAVPRGAVNPRTSTRSVEYGYGKREMFVAAYGKDLLGRLAYDRPELVMDCLYDGGGLDERYDTWDSDPVWLDG